MSDHTIDLSRKPPNVNYTCTVIRFQISGREGVWLADVIPNFGPTHWKPLSPKPKEEPYEQYLTPTTHNPH